MQTGSLHARDTDVHQVHKVDCELHAAATGHLERMLSAVLSHAPKAPTNMPVLHKQREGNRRAAHAATLQREVVEL